MKAIRDVFGDTLVSLGEEYENVIVLNADLGSPTRTNKFAMRFPERTFEIGIAEANMIGISSGLSEHGYKVFLTSFGAFLSGRYDIIRVSLAYPKRPVVLVGTHSGLSPGLDGATQSGLEDISIMRSLPNMVVMQPSTPTETEEVMSAVMNIDAPVYLRIGRQVVEDIEYVKGADYSKEQFHFGKLRLARWNSSCDMTIVYSGCVASIALSVADELEKKGILCRVLNAHTLKPFDWESLIHNCGMRVGENHKFITIEDHSVIGGLGTIVADALSEHCPRKLVKIGVEDLFPSSGKPGDLYEYYGITVQGVLDRLVV